MAHTAATPRGTATSPQRGRRRSAPRWLLWPLGALALILLTLAPDRHQPPPPGTLARTVHVVDHGYHSGLIVSAADLRAAAVMLARAAPEQGHRLRLLASRWPEARWLEIGWGDAAFYQATRGVSDIQIKLAVAALAWPTPSVLQLVPVRGSPEHAFPRSERIALRLSDAQFAALAARLAETVQPDAAGGFAPIAPALYGGGAFFAAAPSYHALRTCNHWVSSLLRAAGVPSSWAFSATSHGLMTELHLRADTL